MRVPYLAEIIFLIFLAIGIGMTSMVTSEIKAGINATISPGAVTSTTNTLNTLNTLSMLIEPLLIIVVIFLIIVVIWQFREVK